MGGDSPAENGNEPYRELFITITFQSPRIAFHPPQLLFLPVPLETKVTATLTLHALGYPRLVCVCVYSLYSHSYFYHQEAQKILNVLSFLLFHLVNMSRETTVSAEVDEVELEDGMKIQPVSVVFPEGNVSYPPLDEVQPLATERLLGSPSLKAYSSLLCPFVPFVSCY